MLKRSVVTKTELPGVPLLRRGKVRDVYDLGDELLIVATDRISCFDVVLGCGIPEKGRVLTALSVFWFDYLRDVTESHFLTADVDKFPQDLTPHKDILRDRSMLVKKAGPLPVECIVRGYLSGSGWNEYKAKQSVCGIRLAAGLKESEKLPHAVFTPSTKAASGHDLNIDEKATRALVGDDAFEEIRRKSIVLYTKAADYAATKGIIIADTKFEFGRFGDRLILIDEVLTPDSSRFWPSEGYLPGRPQPSFDKQFMRDYLEGLSWDKTPPAPEVPEDIIAKTAQKYLRALELLT